MQSHSSSSSSEPLASSSESSDYDFFIIGQGIAGTILAHTLLNQGKKILVIDDWNYSSCSKVTAGLYNPVVFKRLTKSWMIDQLLPVLENFYTSLEQTLGSNLFSRKELIKLFSGENEKPFWIKKAAEENLKHYLSETIEENKTPDYINNTLGAGKVKMAGHVEIKKMLTLSRDFFRSRQMLLEEKFSHHLLVVKPESLLYKNRQANKIIFCEGYRATLNPWFSWLPFKLTKGEIITIKLLNPVSTGWLTQASVLIKGVFILPLGDNTYKVGSTHNWDDLSETTTEKAREELMEKLNQVLKVPYQIIAQEAGIRPTVRDRRPLIGFHPEHKNLLVFNGMGTKGVMLAPYWAAHLAEVMQGTKTLSKEVDISRCHHLAVTHQFKI
jgi:glycine oxidase